MKKREGIEVKEEEEDDAKKIKEVEGKVKMKKQMK